MGGTLKKGDTRLRVIEHYPVQYLGKRNKLYSRYKDEKKIKVDHYKVEYLDGGLYPKGHVNECFLTELYILVKVRSID